VRMTSSVPAQTDFRAKPMQSCGSETEGIAKAISRVEETRLCAPARRPKADTRAYETTTYLATITASHSWDPHCVRMTSSVPAQTDFRAKPMQSCGSETEGIAEAISRVEETRLCAAAAGNQKAEIKRRGISGDGTSPHPPVLEACASPRANLWE